MSVKRTALTLTLILVLLCSGVAGLLFVDLVSAQFSQTITINADGSVEGTDKIQRDRDVYTFTGDIGTDEGSYGIIVQKDNIVIDGAGFLLKGAGPFGYFDIISGDKPSISGIYLEQRKNVTITNLQITGFNSGFSGVCTNIKILGNNITNNVAGIWFTPWSSYITISGNNITDNGSYGMFFEKCSNSIFSENNISGSYSGIQIHYYSYNNTISGNNVTKNRTTGIEFRDSWDNIVFGNDAADNYHGIGIMGSSKNTVSGNNIINNIKYGVWLGDTSNNIFSGNNMANNDAGIWIDGASNNKFYNNNFINNTIHVYDLGIYAPLMMTSPSVNIWNDNENGNYWSDYLTKHPNATEIGDSGIGDTPYVIDANNVDNYPLMVPVDFTEPSILVLSPENKTYDENSIPLNFTVNEDVTQITYKLDGEENVAISGNTTLSGLPNGNHSLTVYAKDEAGNTGASETVFFSVNVPETFPIVPIVVASAVSVVIISIGLLVYFRKRKH